MISFEQLTAFIAVAERQHLTKAAAALRLSPSAVSAAIRSLEAAHGVALFHRVGRGIELTSTGRLFLLEARETLARVRAAEQTLVGLAGLERGSISVQASQTIANYWLPPKLLRFHSRHPGIDLQLHLGNTATVTTAILDGLAELGFIEGTIDEPALEAISVAVDQLMVVAAVRAPVHANTPFEPSMLMDVSWVMREEGSGTRGVFETGLRENGLDPRRLTISLTLPSNEAVLAAVRTSQCAAALSEVVVAPFLANGVNGGAKPGQCGGVKAGH